MSEPTTTTTQESSNKTTTNNNKIPKTRTPTTSPTTTNTSPRRSLYQWCLQERQGILWVLGCALLGGGFGFGIGSGLLTGEYGRPSSAWRIALGMKIRSTTTYQVLSLQTLPWDPLLGRVARDTTGTNTPSHSNSGESSSSARPPKQKSPKSSSRQTVVAVDPQILRADPSHPTVYSVLREAIVRERGGYVHPDVGILAPAPCGAARGVGMVRNDYHACQTQCLPGIAKEKRQMQEQLQQLNCTTSDDCDGDGPSLLPPFKQEEVLIKVPLSFQMTRTVALDTLLPRISPEVQRKANLNELDDAALLVLLLAHERGVGRYSRWLPYIASLPLEPSCGYSKQLRPYLLDSIQALQDELGLDVNGWPVELLKATHYAERIATGLARDYGNFLQHPKGMTAKENIQWALCQVASRATAGSQKNGALRMVPLMDMVNHDATAGGFVELTGKERLEDGDFVDADLEEDSGAFVVRSLRHGRRKALKVGQELLVNYNVPHYSPLDWFVSLGFVPPERWSKWQKMDAALPRIRRDGPFAGMPEGGRGGAASSNSDP
jgi:hypothetical protein